MQNLITPMIQIRATSAIVYNKFNGSRKKSIFQQNYAYNQASGHNFQNHKAYSGSLSAGAIKRLTKALNLFVECSVSKTVYNPVVRKNVQHKLSFVTLTIPAHENVCAKIAQKELLEPMLRHLRQVHKMKSYVWKLELQKRGQIHYHIVTDIFIHYQELRNKWNQLLAKSNLMNEYFTKTGNIDPNSTDIHSVKKIKDLASYLVKYFTKQEQNPVAIKGKLWDCSKNLKAAKYFETELTQDIEYDMFVLSNQKKAVIKRKDSFTFIRFKGFKAVSVFPKETREAYWNHLIEIRTSAESLFQRPEKKTTVLNLVYQKQVKTEISFKGKQLQLNI